MPKKFLIVGTGGVGGSIAGFLALDGNDVSCIARGKHLDEIQRNGLHLKSDLKGEHYTPVKAYVEENYKDQADVIFVCVKQYSLGSISDLLKRASHKGTIIVPILNGFKISNKLNYLYSETIVLDGCIYIVGFVSAPGEVTQMGRVFKLIFGKPKGVMVDNKILMELSEILSHAGIKNEISPCIEHTTFIKWSFISAMACTGAYFNATVGDYQQEGEKRDLFKALSSESLAIGVALGIIDADEIDSYVAKHLNVIDHLAPDSTASMQKDLAQDHTSEINGLLFEMVEYGKSLGISTPTYNRVSDKFKELQK